METQTRNLGYQKPDVLPRELPRPRTNCDLLLRERVAEVDVDAVAGGFGLLVGGQLVDGVGQGAAAGTHLARRAERQLLLGRRAHCRVQTGRLL